jgi:hypothetical protein
MYKITIDYGDEEHCYICNVHGWATNNIMWIKKGKDGDRIYIPLFNVRSVIVETLSKDESERMYIISKGEKHED